MYLPGAPESDAVGYSKLQWRSTAGLAWERGPWSVDWTAQYLDGYCAIDADCSLYPPQGSGAIPSQTYHDAVASWRIDEVPGFARASLRRLTISAGIQNVFDRKPPVEIVTEALGYSSYGGPRLRRFNLSFRASF